MYLEYFDLSAHPFRLTPDSGFLFMCEPHSRAKSYMDHTVWTREGFLVITGEIGCGKTTLIQKLLSELDENVIVARIFQTQLDEVEFLQAVMVKFGLNPFDAKRVELLDMLKTFLVDQFLQNKQIVLIVDDAQNLSMKALEEIRILAGLEARKEKILHVILVGQPQLSEILERPEMEQLKQRVRLRYQIRALSEQEHGEYIRHRLNVVGATDRTLFPPDTLPVIYKYAGGIPRLINTLCDTTLTCAYADNLPGISVDVVEAAAKELQWPPYAERTDKQRSATKSAPSEGGVHEILQEQSHKLALVAARMDKIEELSSALDSIRKRLAEIELHLRNLSRGQGFGARSESVATPRQSSG